MTWRMSKCTFPSGPLLVTTRPKMASDVSLGVGLKKIMLTLDRAGGTVMTFLTSQTTTGTMMRSRF